MADEAHLRLCLSEQRALLARLLHHAERDSESFSNMIGEVDKRLADLDNDATDAP